MYLDLKMMDQQKHSKKEKEKRNEEKEKRKKKMRVRKKKEKGERMAWRTAKERDCQNELQECSYGRAPS